ncbi:3-oxoacyl-ACP synthase [Maribacter polysaccharolyticus]|uniref:3-oxoacyl-ACP synthase n=1 Tax=Maribacter polysaccharolyticus TaxID=3020831 RepID=UPI00237F3D72|nr:3-oxoacyl-ACP synthase [Maribacter polysaccharolyticus]MDE3743232.1 3-oxoacyl-ACP synthase [Maribacter polysaccharolyticus]
MNNLDLKRRLHRFCEDFVRDRISRIHSQINEIQEALSSETKSSAGDKHETGRAMLQLEREKLGRQLSEAEDMQRVLKKVDISTSRTAATLGSLVKTTTANYFLSISAGECKLDTPQKNYCISLNTPIGIMLLGKNVGQTIHFGEEHIKILEIA